MVHMDIQTDGLRSLKTVACVLNDPFKVQEMQQCNLLSVLAFQENRLQSHHM